LELAVGRPYTDELRALPKSYRAVLRVDIDPLVSAVSEIKSLPLVAVGSGGSLSAAQFAVSLHHQFAGASARAVTPLLLTRQTATLRREAVMFFSAGGSNPDVLCAFRRAVEAEPRHLVVVCARVDSPLASLAKRYRWVTVLEFEVPAGRDGFLATNSLLAFGIILTMAYERSAKKRSCLPSSIQNLIVSKPKTFQRAIASIDKRTSKLWSRNHLIVLYGAQTEAAAHDIESKFTEAALGTVQLADYRNFGHGRHHWLAKHGSDSALLAFRTRQDGTLVDATLKHIPSVVPVVELSVPGDWPAAGLASIVQSILLAGCCGRARGIDPGRPGVPSFGRRLYHLRAPDNRNYTSRGLSLLVATAIERKTQTAAELLPVASRREYVSDYDRYVKRIRAARFDAIALDYDGTLCDRRERISGPCNEILAELTRLLDYGISIMIVTGRGKSVREDLRRGLPRRTWKHLSVAYYNGAQIGRLAEDPLPEHGTLSGPLATAQSLLSANRLIATQATCEYRAAQISIQPLPALSPSALYEIVVHTLSPQFRTQLTVVRSGHSVDVLGPGVSKLRAVETLSSNGCSTLAIGDAGRWPGNDFELLSQGLTLSVDEASADPLTCWNLAPPGMRGAQATAYYLRLLQPSSPHGKLRMRL
jgi:fructoselysine-6-P-deglycase FrlB-like protein